MISVIVPIYNAAHYLSRCVGSILTQKNADFELLLVDDGSQDESTEMCDAYAKQDTRVRVFHIANGGAAHARNYGLDQANGEFVLFVDADDLIPQNHFSVLQQLQQKYDADMAVGSVKYVPGPTISHVETVCTTEQYLALILYRDGTGDYPISKLYRREMFTGIRFEEGITSEDFEIFYRLYSQAKTIAITDKTTYYYQQNAGSVSNGGFSPKFFNRKEICKRLINEVQKDYPNLLPAAYSRMVDEMIWLFGITPPAYKTQRAEMCQLARQYIPLIKHNPCLTAKVQRKIFIFQLSPQLWILRMKLKALLLHLYANRRKML